MRICCRMTRCSEGNARWTQTPHTIRTSQLPLHFVCLKDHRPHTITRGIPKFASLAVSFPFCVGWGFGCMARNPPHSPLIHSANPLSNQYVSYGTQYPPHSLCSSWYSGLKILFMTCPVVLNPLNDQHVWNGMQSHYAVPEPCPINGVQSYYTEGIQSYWAVPKPFTNTHWVLNIIGNEGD